MSVSKKFIITLMTVIVITFAIPFASYAFEAVTGVGSVTADSLNVRTGPGKDYDAMGKLYSGNTVEVLGVDGEWLKIEYQNQEGYVSMQYVDFEPDEVEEVEEVVEDEEVFEENETEDEPVYNYKLIFGLVGAIIVLFIVILVTIKSIKGMDEDDDEDEDDDDDEYDDDDEDDDEYEEDEEDDEEYEYVMVRRPKQNSNTSQASNRQPQRSSKAVKRTDDYTLDIDPRYFD